MLKPLSITILLTSLLLAGCSQTSTLNSYRLNQNKLLNKKEEAYAIRMYELINSDDFYDEKPFEEDIELESTLFTSGIYKKWGFGDKTEFSYEEKLYLGQIEDIASAWNDYKNALNDFKEHQIEYLQEMHEQYGSGPINIRKEGMPSEMDDKILMMLEALCGSEKIDDRALILFHNWKTTLVI